MSLKIYQRGEVWHYRGTVAGRRLRGSTGAADKDIAARIAAEREAKEWKRDLDGPAAVLTFAQAAILYRAAGKPTRFLDVVEDHWKDTLVREITAGDIRQAALMVYPKAAAATRNRQFIVPTQAIINHAAEMDLCPTIRVRRFKVETKVKKPVTIEWMMEFVKHAKPHMRALALFMFATGARVSEAIALQWKDVDLKKRSALIKQTKIGSQRMAHLPPPLVVALGNLPKDDKRGVFFYVTRGAALNAWVAAIERAGIDYRSFHSCRHGFATSLLHNGVDPVTIAWLGGWKSPARVFSTYGHAKDDPTITNALFDTVLTQPVLAQSRKPMKIGKN